MIVTLRALAALFPHDSETGFFPEALFAHADGHSELREDWRDEDDVPTAVVGDLKLRINYDSRHGRIDVEFMWFVTLSTTDGRNVARWESQYVEECVFGDCEQGMTEAVKLTAEWLVASHLAEMST